MSLLILNIRAKRRGKTTVAIKIAMGMLEKGDIEGIIVFDVQRERKYAENSKIKRFHGTADEFLQYIKTLRNHCIIVDEAATVFPVTLTTREVLAHLTAAGHSGNTLILNFHGMSQVSKSFKTYIDYLYIGKTNDDLQAEYKKWKAFPQLLLAFEKVKQSSNKYCVFQVRMSFT